MSTTETVETPAALPAGDYAIVEVLGHRTYVGRVTEEERFGSKLLSIEAIFAGQLLPAVLVGGGSIYQLTPCSAETAFARGPKDLWQLPTSVRCIVPPALLPAPSADDDEDEGPF